MRPQPHLFRSLGLCLAMLLGVFAGARSAAADSIRVKGFWYNDVSVDSIAAGKVTYVGTGGSTLTAPLADVDGFKVTRYPDLEKGELALEQNRLEHAFNAYLKVRDTAAEPWVKMWCNFRLVRCADQLEYSNDAAVAYLDLIKVDADKYFLTKRQPTQLGKLSKEQKKVLLEQVAAAKKKAKPDTEPFRAADYLLKEVEKAPGLETAVVRAAVKDDPVALVPPPKDPLKPGEKPKAGVAPIARLKSVIPTPRAMDREDDRVANALRGGRFDEALKEVEKVLTGTEPDSMSTRLYQRGLAQMYLAETAPASEKTAKYKDAGLSFMRVVIYYPRTLQWMTPSLIEAAYVHHHLGRDDIALTLLDEAEKNLDAEEEPEMAARLTKIRAMLKDPTKEDAK